ncbi:hypothetical protein CPB86DRAFT_745978 [Serendipita vermifera]|nr:hypothetical protein CPB86DRAFT_745978 [Serendipita vermifera]
MSNSDHIDHIVRMPVLGTAENEQLTLNCYIVGSFKDDLPLTVPCNQQVDQLRKTIKMLFTPELDNVDSKDLSLWKVDVPLSLLKASGGHSIIHDNESSKRLDGLDPISSYWSLQPSSDRVHLLVSIPDDPELKTPPQQFPQDKVTPPKNEITYRLEASAPRLKARISRYLRRKVQLPSWKPQRGTPEIRKYIESLNIPAPASSRLFPSLLLHNLGELSYDQLLPGRIEGLFFAGSILRFLCNTSGSGKTRLLFEGLCRNWGFYFTACRDPDYIGSLDLETTIGQTAKGLKPLPEENFQDTLEKNSSIATRCFLLLLYARISTFCIFLQCAKEIDGEIKEEHKKLWLLIQVLPSQLLGQDIFVQHLLALGRPSLDDLYYLLSIEIDAVDELLDYEPVFCVVDEAQGITHKFEECFRSYKDEKERRPILRELIKNWEKYNSQLIISGTGISMKKMETTLSSGWAKPPPDLLWTDVGAFDTQASQHAYLSQYISPNYVDPLLASRLEYWLCGRYRFTAIYVQFMLKNGFSSPHLLLNQYISAMTNRMTAEEELPSETPLDDELKAEIKNTVYAKEADFKSLRRRFEEEPSLKNTLTSFFYELFITGKKRSLGGKDGELLVELGISKFKNSGVEGHREAEITENLVIYGLFDLFESLKLTMEDYLLHELGSPHPSSRGLAFESFGAFLLARSFSSPRPLSDVFEFVGDLAIKDELAQLIALERSDNSFRQTPININSTMPPDHLGCSPNVEGMLKWLEDPKGTAFCFPPNIVGPDLILMLRLTQHGTILRVCVQIKNTENLSGTERTRAIRTTDPNYWFSQHKNNQWTISSPSMQESMIQALQNLGAGTDMAGTCSVLRVVFAHPPLTNRDELNEAAKEPHGHPVATISVSKLEPKDSKSAQMLDELSNRVARGPHKKRKRESGSLGEDGSKTKEDTVESSPKRRKGKATR